MIDHNRKKAMLVHSLFALIVLGVLTLPASAQQVNLSGTWKLNLAKSFLAGDHPMPGYTLTKTIEQRGAKVTITDASVHDSMFGMTLPNSTVTSEYADGAKGRKSTGPCPFGIPPAEVEFSAEWQGGTFLITEVGGCFGVAATTERRYFLSRDGSQLIELIVGHATTGDTEQRLVFEKS